MHRGPCLMTERGSTSSEGFSTLVSWPVAAPLRGQHHDPDAGAQDQGDHDRDQPKSCGCAKLLHGRNNQSDGRYRHREDPGAC